jgi:hypothetical protein
LGRTWRTKNDGLVLYEQRLMTEIDWVDDATCGDMTTEPLSLISMLRILLQSILPDRLSWLHAAGRQTSALSCGQLSASG